MAVSSHVQKDRGVDGGERGRMTPLRRWRGVMEVVVAVAAVMVAVRRAEEMTTALFCACSKMGRVHGRRPIANDDGASLLGSATPGRAKRRYR